MTNLNPVEATVIVAGQQVHFVHLSLSQKFNAHHHFTIEIDFEEFGGKWMDSPVKMINFIGQDVNITMKHKETGESNLFTGIITQVSHTGYHGQQNNIIISGCSPTIKLAGKPTMNSFMDLPLQQIVNEAVGDSGNGGSVIANPVFGSKLDYVCQYDENCFDFLNRLSWEYGEWFYFDGLNTYFGLRQGDNATIEYDKEMTYFDLSAQLVPGKFNRYHYLHHDPKEINKDEPASVPGERGYLIVSKRRSESIYTSVANSPLSPAVNTKKDLDDLVKAERGRDVGEMLIMRGKTKTCKVKIGGTVSVRLPSNMDVVAKSVDTFLVISVNHEIDQQGHYNNSFEGIIAGIEAIPMSEPKIPIAHPQIATVKTNDDDKKRGRVKVQTQWQKSKGKTSNWIRVQTPDAGKSDMVSKNRGFVFIPEKDDLVMIGFEYGNPDRPYIAGSIFSEKISRGNGVGNHIKTITDKSRGQIMMNADEDGEWGITIHDRNGNIMHFDTKEKNITITTPETMTLNAKNMNINVQEDMTINVQRNWLTQISGEKNENIGKDEKIFINQDFELEAKNTRIKTSRKSNIQAGEKLEQIAGEMIMHSNRGEIIIDGTGKITIQSKDRIDYGE